MSGSVINRDRLAKVLALMSSPVDGKALATTRTAVKMLADFDFRPENLVDGIPKPVKPIGFEVVTQFEFPQRVGIADLRQPRGERLGRAASCRPARGG